MHRLVRWFWLWVKKGKLDWVSKIVELAVLDRLSNETREVWFCPVGLWKSWDGISLSRQHSCEVKFDSRARDTMNIFLECRYRGENSGLWKTEASSWCHVVPVDERRLAVLQFDTVKLKEAVRRLPLIRGGDYNASQGVLLPLPVAERLAERRFTLEIPWQDFRPYWKADA